MNKFAQLLKDKGFSAYLITQFLGAFNDNLFKQVLILYSLNAVLNNKVDTDYTLLAQGLFVLPFLLFSGYAGFFADRFRKHRVLQFTKSIEIVAMLLAALAFSFDHIPGLLAVLFLMATQSTFFSPAKYGILPEILPDEELSRANALLELTTFAAIILGGALGAVLFEFASDQLGTVASGMIAIAIIGTVCAWWITPTQQRDDSKKFALFPWKEIISGTKHLYKNDTLWLTTLGITWFWFLGAAVQIDVMYLGKVSMQLSDMHTGFLAAFLGIGIGAGSMIAGVLSGDKIELGLVPLGSLGMFISGLILPGLVESYWATALCLSVLGAMAGLYIVPLNALIQEQADEKRKGEILATVNFYTMVGALFAAGMMAVFQHVLKLDPVAIISVLGTFTLLATLYALKVLPHFFARLITYALAHTLFRINVLGQPHLPLKGPALIVSNHISYLDGLLITACTQRFVRFMVYKPIYENRWLNPIFRLANAIPVQGGNEANVKESLERARAELEAGHVVCIFAEGRITRTGNLLPFRKGLERIAEGLNAPIVPVHMHGIWGSALSLRNKKVRWTRPLTSPYRLTISFGEHLPSNATAWQVRRAIQDLSSQGAIARQNPKRNLLSAWLNKALANPRQAKLQDAEQNLNQLGILKRYLSLDSKPQNQVVAVSAAPSINTVATHLHLLSKGHIIVPLDPREDEKRQLEKAKIAGATFAICDQASLAEKMEGNQIAPYAITYGKAINPIAPWLIRLLPKGLTYWLFSKPPSKLDDVAYRLFSRNKSAACEISHGNVLANIEALGQVFQLSEKDRLLAPLPYSHAFGLVAQLWLPLLSDVRASLIADGLDQQAVNQALRKQRPTVILDTVEALEASIASAQADLFSSARYVIAAGKPSNQQVAYAFHDKFSVALLSGYGMTEMSPGVAVNTPDIKSSGQLQRGLKTGSIGQPLPGVSVKIVDASSGEECGPGKSGELWVGGPGLCKGYVKYAEHQAIEGAWFNTHDHAQWDEEGFLFFEDTTSEEA